MRAYTLQSIIVRGPKNGSDAVARAEEGQNATTSDDEKVHNEGEGNNNDDDILEALDEMRAPSLTVMESTPKEKV